jgi:hypothetical protein
MNVKMLALVRALVLTAESYGLVAMPALRDWRVARVPLVVRTRLRRGQFVTLTYKRERGPAQALSVLAVLDSLSRGTFTPMVAGSSPARPTSMTLVWSSQSPSATSIASTRTTMKRISEAPQSRRPNGWPRGRGASRKRGDLKGA